MNIDHPPLVRTKPPVEKHQAAVLAARLFNLHITDLSFVKELNSYDDRNFYMRGSLNGQRECQEYVLKIINDVESRHECLLPRNWKKNWRRFNLNEVRYKDFVSPSIKISRMVKKKKLLNIEFSNQLICTWSEDQTRIGVILFHSSTKLFATLNELKFENLLAVWKEFRINV